MERANACYGRYTIKLVWPAVYNRLRLFSYEFVLRHNDFESPSFKSYLANCSQFFRIGDSKSDTTCCKADIPQGSVLGPFLFTLYISPNASIATKYGLKHQQYADNKQLCVAASRIIHTFSRCNIEQCLIELHAWFTNNSISLIPDKSEVILWYWQASSLPPDV